MTGQPVSAATVTLHAGGGGEQARATTDAEGRASFAPLAPGRVRIVAASPGLGAADRVIDLAPGRRTQVVLTLAVAITEQVSVGAYHPPASTTASKLETVPAQDTPFSAQFVPRQVLEDQQARTVNDALRNVSGVATQIGIGDLIPRQRIRGFVPQSQLKNGFRQNLLSTLNDLANVERVEVLKGPASALYGAFEPGGVVNLISKAPLSEPFHRIELSAGSFRSYRLTGDISGPLDGRARWLYRTNAAFEDAESYRDFVTKRIGFVAPALTWRATDRTTLTTEVEYLSRTGGYDRGFGNSALLLELPLERNLGEPSDSTDYDGTVARYDLRHAIGDAWQLRHALLASFARLDTLHFTPGFPLLVGRQYLRIPQHAHERQRDVAVQTELSGTVRSGALEHTLLLGVEYAYDRNAFTFMRGAPSRLDIDHPVYGAPADTPDLFSVGSFRTAGWSAYLQDQVALGSRWTILAGGRFDAIESRSQSEFNIFEPPYDRRRDTPTFSPRAGVTFAPSPAWTLYGSYARAFRSDLFGTIVGGLPEPSVGEQVEAGVKGEWLGGRLSTTASVYRLVKRKVLVANPDDPFGPSLQVGEQQSSGLEIDVLGRAASRLSLLASYSLTDAEVTKDTTLPIGSRLPNVPRHAGSVWATYQLPGHALQGTAIGLGLFASGPRAATSDNSFELPAYARVDALVAWRHGRLNAALNITNLTNERYFESGGGFVPIYPQAPRSFLGSVGVVF